MFLYSPTSHIGSLACHRFKIANEPPVSLPNGSFVRLDLVPGTYQIDADTSWCFAVPVSGTVRINEDEKVFVKLSRKIGYWPSAARSPGPDDFWLGFEVIPTIDAEKEIADLGRKN